MILMVFGVQVIVRLYATSAITSAATAAADAVAEAGGSVAAVPGAQAAADARLGAYATSHVRWQWLEVDASEVTLRVIATSPELLPLPGGFLRIVRTVTARTQVFR